MFASAFHDVLPFFGIAVGGLAVCGLIAWGCIAVVGKLNESGERSGWVALATCLLLVIAAVAVIAALWFGSCAAQIVSRN